ncbi:hypothetical protein ACLBWT_12225 [Paenibacillus sp. D51F]
MNVLDFRRLVDKSYVISRLKGTEHEKEVSKLNMDDLFQLLRENYKDFLFELEEIYGFAGKTSLNIFEAKNFPKEAKNKEHFVRLLSEYIELVSPGLLKGDQIPIGRQMQPPLEVRTIPNLVIDREDGFLIQLVNGIPNQVPDGWGIRTVIRPHYETVIVRLSETDPVFVEVRSGYRMCNQYLSIIEDVVKATPGQLTWEPLTKLSEQEAERIAELLDAGLVEADHLGTGIYGRKSVSAAEGIDLRKEQKYQDEYNGLQYLSQTMNVKYTDSKGFVSNISFKVQMNGGFQFLSKVNEQMITSVMEAFYQVRYIERIDRATGTEG